MKKIILLLAAVMIFSVQGFSQAGIKAGLNFNSAEDFSINNSSKSNLDNKTGFHVGLLYNFKIPLTGLSIQPELMYAQNKSNLKGEAAEGEFKLNTLKLAASVQWGIDLMLLRPFIQVVPYAGYTLNSKTTVKDLEWDVEKLRYGVGLGAGLDVWKLQVSCRYNWDLGKAEKFKMPGLGTFKGNKYETFEVSLAYFF